MLMIPGFSLTEHIHNSTHTCIYRGKKGNQSVILKTLKDEYPTIEAIARFKYEYSIVQDFHHENIVAATNLETDDKRLVLVFEDFGGISLKQYLEKTKVSVDFVLEIAIAVTQALIYIHSHRIIHKDIKPGNIIINPTTGEVKLTDFSIACRLSKEFVTNNPNQIEGTFSYMSPEQTGRMNRSLDYRSDFYSLGVTLYQMLTGQLPFNSNDVMELVHSHIALNPTPVREINPAVPEVFAGIIDKLMAKNAEDRYQSAKGLLVDLEELAGGNTSFIPGEMDLRSQLLIPQKLYGREEQVISLLKTFEEVALSKSQLMLVSGYSGIGKTSVINEINKPITARNGYFVSGKFDQFKRDIPYASLIQAFSDLMRQLLTETSAKIEIWQEKIKTAVGSNGQVVIDVIPEVELIIGKQPPISELPPTEAQNRFNRVFQEFIKVFCTKEHPLVIFLDDLQWADLATLKLMQLLVTDRDIQHLMLIGAYRDNEVPPTHPLITTVEEIEKAGTYVNHIVLQSLGKTNVGRLVAETLNDNKNTSKELAALIFNKTGGNPFFITQLLQALYQESLLIFDFSLREWTWDIEAIKATEITDKNVVNLVADRIKKLPSCTQEVLKLAACIGDKFSLSILSIVNKKSALLTAIDLNAGLQEGFIVPLNEAYRIPLLFKEQESVFDNHKICYKFLHDRVQQAAYSLIPENKRQQSHLYIGQLLKLSTPSDELEENILYIVNQLNFGIDLLSSQSEKYELAYLNLTAGKKAKRNAAYQAAITYLRIGLNLLELTSWESNYNLTLDLYIETAEAEYLNGNFEKSSEIANTSIKKAKSILELTRIYEIKIQSYVIQNKLQEALDTGLEVLKRLSISLPNKPSMLDLLVGIAKTKLIMMGKKTEDLASLSLMTDPHQLAAMKILMLITPAASQVGSKVFPLIIFAMVRLSVKAGNCLISAYAYTLYGAILCDKFGDIDGGYRLGKLGLNLLENIKDSKSLKCKVYCLFYLMIEHFKEPSQMTIQPMREGIQSGLETGDIEYASYNASFISHNLFLSGNNLDLVYNMLIKYVELMQKLKLEPVVIIITNIRKSIVALQGQSANKLSCLQEYFNQTEAFIKLGDNATGLSSIYVYNTIICFFFGDYNKAIYNACLTQKYQEDNPGFYLYCVSNFYYSLSILQQYYNFSVADKKKYLKQVAANQKKMKLWAHHAPCNYQHKYDLVEAEKARITGKKTIASDFYDKAIAGAKANNYTQEEALANELAAKFYLEQGKENIAKVYMTWDIYFSR